MKQNSPDFLAFLAAADASDEPVTEIEIQGRRLIVERNPEPGVLVRMRPADGSSPSTVSLHFEALDQRPPSYPAWLPFIPGHEASVAVWGDPEIGAVSWPEVNNPDDVITPLLEILRQEGWTGEETRTGRGSAPVEFLAFERDGRRCMVMSSSVGGESVVMLSSYPAPVSATSALK